MYLPMADLDLITIIEDWNTPDHKVVGVGISIPSLARALQKCGGKLFPFGWWHILRALKFHKTEVVDLLLIGVLPEYRQKGANALLFYDLIPHYQRLGFKWGETHVEMETNMEGSGTVAVSQPRDTQAPQMLQEGYLSRIASSRYDDNTRDAVRY